MPSPKNLRALQVGTALADGSIYAGISPSTGFPLIVAAEDRIVRACNVPDAAVEAVDHGQLGWRAPTYAELEQIRSVRNVGDLKGKFKEEGGGYTSYYATSDIVGNGMSDAEFMRVRMMGEGDKIFPAERDLPLIFPVSLRLVRA